jgi:hypothetical protein
LFLLVSLYTTIDIVVPVEIVDRTDISRAEVNDNPINFAITAVA